MSLLVVYMTSRGWFLARDLVVFCRQECKEKVPVLSGQVKFTVIIETSTSTTKLYYMPDLLVDYRVQSDVKKQLTILR